jgi:hypothetical protein
VVLDTKTFEWYHGTEVVSTRAPYMQHTATLYNDYMFIAFGKVFKDNKEKYYYTYLITLYVYIFFRRIEGRLARGPDSI